MWYSASSESVMLVSLVHGDVQETFLWSWKMWICALSFGHVRQNVDVSGIASESTNLLRVWTETSYLYPCCWMEQISFLRRCKSRMPMFGSFLFSLKDDWSSLTRSQYIGDIDVLSNVTDWKGTAPHFPFSITSFRERGIHTKPRRSLSDCQ